MFNYIKLWIFYSLFVFNGSFITKAKSYKCSSELREKTAYYAAENLNTKGELPWASANGYGIGDVITIELPRDYNLQLIVLNGFQSETRKDLYIANSRVKRIRIKCIENEHAIDVELQDIQDEQRIDLSVLKMVYDSYVTLEITVLDIYPGERYKDLCIQAIIPEYWTD